ncbi:MAG: transcriptional regulator [Acidimicrobiia bacterium]|nr:transcriptional regulator [Acidimicrobiia bacterium]
MSHPSPLPLRILHCLRLKGFADVAGIARSIGADRTPVDHEVAQLYTHELVALPGHGALGWALTSAGRTESERLVAAELDAAGVRRPITSAYERFLGLNGEVRSICTEWQIRDDVLNDHADVSYDRHVIGRLAQLHDNAGPVCADLAAQLERFACYGERLGATLERLVAGDGQWFTQPLIDSYHTVWFELHEDLLATLGIDRAAEASRT